MKELFAFVERRSKSKEAMYNRQQDSLFTFA